MGAPAIARPARTKPRPKPRPKARPKPAPRQRSGAARPAKRPAVATGRRTNHRSRSPVAAGGNVAMLPVHAVGGIADSGFVVGLARGRAWIVILGFLLGGIVAVNVLGLSLSAAGSETSTRIDELQQQNSVLRTRIASRLSNEQITRAASALGLAVPAPDAVRYLDAKASDAEDAAKRLADGLIATAAPAAAPVETELTDPALADPAVTDPALADPAAAVPVDPYAATTSAPVDPALVPPTP